MKSVGNGGFSLRSQRLLQAGLDARIRDEHPEDAVLCRQYRALLEKEHGVRFAPPAVARHFTYENETPLASTFGFHGPKNLAAVLDGETLLQWLDALPDDFFRGRDARRLARALLRHGEPRVASALIRRRHAAGRRDAKTRVMGWVAAAMARFARP